MASSNKLPTRSRNFACVVYPESAPKDWQQILSDQHINCIVSPLHDQDKNPDGVHKKDHYHVMLVYDSLKSVAQASAIFEMIGGVGCIVVESLRQMARYFCHLDNPDKAPYKKSDVKVFGDLDYLEIVNSAADEIKLQRDVLQLIEDNDLIMFSDLIDILAGWDRYSEHFRFVTRKATLFFATYLKSREYKIRLQVQNEKAAGLPAGNNKPKEV